MAKVKIFRHLVQKNPFGERGDEGELDLPDCEEVVNIRSYNDVYFEVITWTPPMCRCEGCALILIDLEDDDEEE